MKEKQFIKRTSEGTFYYKDEAHKILHREDGPAMEWKDGTYSYYRNNKIHRLDGPAMYNTHSDKAWYVDGELITFAVKDKYSGAERLQLALKHL